MMRLLSRWSETNNTTPTIRSLVCFTDMHCFVLETKVNVISRLSLSYHVGSWKTRYDARDCATLET